MMRCCSKEMVCHSNSPPKTNNVNVCHFCPSKLSKRELEDLYYKLAQNNLELKQTINQLNEKMKYQTTKLQRLIHTQQSYMGSEPRDCCATAKTIVQEQKQVIIELKNTNEDLQEQINNLNMKLCSTKQFLPRSTTAKTTPRGRGQSKDSPANRQKGNSLPRSATAKNSSTSALHHKCFENAAENTAMKSVSSLHLDSAATKTSKNPNTPRRQTTDPPSGNQSARKPGTPSKIPITDKMCDQNKCRTQMDEMQRKILKLQEELAKTHDEYANRIARLEREVIDLHAENMKVCSEKAMFEQNVKARSNEAGDIKKKLMDAETRCEKLTAHLNIEKGKVAELETQVKAANMTGGAMSTIEERFNNGNTPNTRRDSIYSTRSSATSPTANASETKNTENRYLQGPNGPNKRICCFKDLAPGSVTNSPKNEENHPDISTFTDNLKQMYTKYIEPEEPNFKFDASNGQDNSMSGNDPANKSNIIGNQNLPGNRVRGSDGIDDNFERQTASDKLPNNIGASLTSRHNHKDNKCRYPVSDKSTTFDGQDNHMTCDDPACKSNIKGNEKLPGNRGRGPDGINDNFERQTASDKLPNNSGASVTSRDNFKDIKCRCPTPDKSTTFDSQDNPMTCNDPACKSNVKDNENLPENRSSSPGGINDNVERQAVSDKLPNSGASVTSRDNFKDVESRYLALDKSPISDGQDNPMIDNDVMGKQNLPGNRGRGPDGSNDNCERQAASDKLPTSGASVTSRDNFKDVESRYLALDKSPISDGQDNPMIDNDVMGKQNLPGNRGRGPENTAQNASKYRENIAFRLRCKDRPAVNDTNARNICGNENQPNEQELRDHQADRTSIGIVKLDNGILQGDPYKSENTNDQQRSRSPRVDKNLESGAGKCLKTGDEKTDYTTEYGRQFNIRKDSLGVRSYEKQGGASPPLAQIVHKSNESSCYCSGKCQCINTNKIMLSTAGTATTSAGPSKETRLSTADEEELNKFKAMFKYTSIELGPPQPLQKLESPLQQAQTPMAQRGGTSDKSPDTSVAKTADDSGFNEPDVRGAAPLEGRALLRENRNLEKKVAEIQAQLEQLKTHVLTRKSTYTVFKDEGTTSDSEQKTECGIQMSTQDQEYQRDQDGKIETIRLTGSKYISPGQSNLESSCESTCGKEGLPCTKECQSENKKKYLYQRNIQNNERKKYDNSRYQIPGPLSAYSSDVSAVNRVYDDNDNTRDTQHTQFDNSAQHQFEENNRGTGSPQNTNFYEDMNPRVPINTGSIKEESPPTNRTQYISMRDTIANRNNQEENINAPYARGALTIPNNQNGIDSLNARTPQYTNDDPYPYAKETPKTIQNQENEHHHLQDAVVKPVAANLKPREDESMSGKNTPTKDASKDKKNSSITCMCPHDAKYMMNILHTATAPKTVANSEISKSLGTTSRVNAENVSLSNSPPHSVQQKPKITPNTNLTNIEDSSRIRNVPGYDGGLGTSSSERRELFGIKDSDSSKLPKSGTNEEDNKIDVFEEKPLYLKRSNMGDANKVLQQRSIESEQKKEIIDKVNNIYDENERIFATSISDKRDKRNENVNLDRNRVVEKSSGSEENNTKKNDIQKFGEYDLIRNNDEQLQQRRLTRFMDDNDPVKLGDTKRADVIQNIDKYQQNIRPQCRLVDVDSRERQNGNNIGGGKMLNIDEKQETVRRRDSRLSAKTPYNNTDTDKMRQAEPFYSQQPISTPVATSSPFTCSAKRPNQNLKVDRATDNQLGTQRGNADNNYTEQNTYTVKASASVVKDERQKARVQKCSRGTSPENTDQEISSLTDLPSERETTTTPSQSPRCRKCTRYSPGEDKSTTTKSETVADPTLSSSISTTFPLSEGEMPQYSAGTNNQRQESVYTDPQPLEEKRRELAESSSMKLEQALASISEELARCRKLLEKPEEIHVQKQAKRPGNTMRLKDLVEHERHSDDENPYGRRKSLRGAALNQSGETSVFALHHAQAKPHISNGPDTPHVMFTLHIGTIVLSDEAVINSRNLNLVLTWKFYDQNVAMSHMQPGRVINFDFSTEYDLKLTDQFLNYLKAEELQIKICEVNRLDCPIASCSLPLREALLHTNRRADMSLALVAGPYMTRSTPDSLDTRDEMGVLDLWCMLRAEPRIVPRINKAIAKSRPSRINANGMRQQNYANNSLSPLITQLDDDQDDMRLSSDLDQNFQQPDRLPVVDSNETTSTQSKARQQFMAYPHPRPRVSISPNQPNTRPARFSSANTDIITQLSSGRPNDTYLFSTNKDLKRTASGFIINEVPAAIRSDEEMRMAITERTKLTHQTSFPPTLLQDGYTDRNTQTRLDAQRLSGGQFSIPSLGNTARSMGQHVRSPVDNSSLNLGPSAYSVSRDWKKADEISRLKMQEDSKKIPDSELTRDRRDSSEPKTSRYDGTKKAMESYKAVKNKKERIKHSDRFDSDFNYLQDKGLQEYQNEKDQTIDIIILWLALNEECAAMSDPTVQKLYVAYSFLGRSGAELETPQSLSKPKQYQDKCYFNFKKSFQLTDADMAVVGRLGRCRSPQKGMPNPRDSVVFTVVSEPVEDPLGLNNCEDIGTAYLYFGDLIAYSANSDTYTEVIPIWDSKAVEGICGVLSIRVDGLNVVRKCLTIY